MRKITLFLSFSLLAAAVTAQAADVTVKGQGSDVTVSGEPSGDVTVQQSPGNPAANPSANTSAQAQAVQWTMLKGEVQNIDHQAQRMTLKLDGSDSVVNVPTDPKTVAIYKNGDHKYDVADVKAGDDVVLRRLL
jgi:hypothetical protein